MKIEACEWIIRLPGKLEIDCPRIAMMEQIDGSKKFAVRFRGMNLNHTDKWEREPIPLWRNDKFLKRCRFDNFTNAARALEIKLEQDGIL